MEVTKMNTKNTKKPNNNKIIPFPTTNVVAAQNKKARLQKPKEEFIKFISLLSGILLIIYKETLLDIAIEILKTILIINVY